MVGIAESTLSKIESLRLPLSGDNAAIISAATGVSAGWLLDGNPAAPPKDRDGAGYTSETFARWRASAERPYADLEARDDSERDLIRSGFATMAGSVLLAEAVFNAAVLAVADLGPAKAEVFMYKLQRAVGECLDASGLGGMPGSSFDGATTEGRFDMVRALEIARDLFGGPDARRKLSAAAAAAGAPTPAAGSG